MNENKDNLINIDELNDSLSQRDTVLLIDDNEGIHTLFDHVADNYNVTHALTGEEGIAKAIEQQPTMILLDINLDDISGYDVCEKLKANKETCDIPVVFLSAWGGTKARMTGYTKGATNYIEKPFQVKEVNAMVRAIIENSKRMANGDVQTFGNLEVHFDQHEVFLDGKLKHMTQNEFKIFAQLIKHPSSIISREALLNTLSPVNNQDQHSRVIDTHISSIRKKIANSKVKIKTIHSRGYRAVIEA